MLARSIRVARRFASSNAHVGPKLNSVAKYINGDSWDTKDLLDSNNQKAKLDESVLDGLLDLSGLQKNMSKQDRSKLWNSLHEQLAFLDKLQSIETLPNAELTRLVDDAKDETLSYDSLMQQIAETKPDLDKGEVEDSWQPLTFSKESEDGYYVVKEGLIKKNKV